VPPRSPPPSAPPPPVLPVTAAGPRPEEPAGRRRAASPAGEAPGRGATPLGPGLDRSFAVKDSVTSPAGFRFSLPSEHALLSEVAEDSQCRAILEKTAFLAVVSPACF